MFSDCQILISMFLDSQILKKTVIFYYKHLDLCYLKCEKCFLKKYKYLDELLFWFVLIPKKVK